ncbi:ABC transporter substrate-binding protein [Azospirillum sp. SYSU D00513]|uniref:ABC transporter substrate-binding protein n=1 Tax=Azospirillum sp. SYSU D00513 TaxID=2812561 RepID=UPI001A970EF3|nr:ABC transporter substrate-binding protein [Azospirillum sp. SYSU D00513]
MTTRRALLGALLATAFGLGLPLALQFPAQGQAPAASQPAAAQAVRIGYLSQEEDPRIPLTFLEPELTDEGVQGARLALADNNTTGRFTNQKFELVETVVPRDGDPAEGLRSLAADGVRLVVLDLPAEALAKVAALPEAAGLLLFNSRAPDDALRNEGCRANLLHTIPSRRMLTDALGQYLVWKKWVNWALIVGPAPEDKLYAEAVRRTAKRFGARIVEEKAWTFDTSGNRRTDTGLVTIQSEIPVATQLRDHDVLIVADETDQFGEYLDGHTWLPRPVAGTQGYTPTAWARVNEQWGATQMHNRFERLAGRWMTARDYAAWLAVRSVGEAATRTASGDPAAIAAFVRSPQFELAGFKGPPFTYRDWDGQLRQPVLIAGPRMLVSVSPQEGFLHQNSLLDTLGDDAPESKCRKAR